MSAQGKAREEKAGLTLLDKVHGAVLVPSFLISRVYVPVHVRRPATSNRPGCGKETPSERDVVGLAAADAIPSCDDDSGGEAIPARVESVSTPQWPMITHGQPIERSLNSLVLVDDALEHRSRNVNRWLLPVRHLVLTQLRRNHIRNRLHNSARSANKSRKRKAKYEPEYPLPTLSDSSRCGRSGKSACRSPCLR